MQNTWLPKLNSWLEKKLSYPGCTDKQLQGNITAFENHIFLIVYAFLVEICCLIFAPHFTLGIQYLTLFTILYILSLVLQLLFPSHHLAIHAFIGSTMHLLTFYYVFQMGGIPTSCGLIFVGLANVLATVPRQNALLSISMFIIYSVWVILLVVLKPWLHIPDQLTPELNSILFMACAIILTGATLVFVLRFIRQQQKLEEMETRHLKEINEFKDRFFTNITHEFRTPLTIIKGMADLIRAQPQEWIGNGLEKIKTNSDILLQLVNQMLNLAKNEAGATSVNFVRRNVNKYLTYLVEQFSSEALRRKIDLRLALEGEQCEMDFDPEILMHIINNLLSNAMKYTLEGGEVEVITSLRDNGNMFAIKVRDTGIGIEKEHLDHLFDRFYRVEHQLSPGGTGIGLALTKEMVQLLKGTIYAESTKGVGSEFTVLLPVTHNATLSDTPELTELIAVKDDQYEKVNLYGETIDAGQSPGTLDYVGTVDHTELPLLLIVEDNSDVVLYLQTILKNEYRIEVAGNGDIGIKKSMESIPNIILSDVMMPVMDGIELLEKVKNDLRTSHIPVVMLSAKADIDSRLAGLERGADAYLSKPFNEKELRIQLNNLVSQRKMFCDRYALLDKIPETSDKFIKKEDDFMKKIKDVLEANLTDDEFGVSRLCRELAVSRAQLYRKVRALSDRTIADYFKALRLSKAKELLLAGDLNVTEVSIKVGFKSLAYFSREFTHEFGLSPSEFRK
jgi:signal transduction histidine kinase/DNA-binding response OmpR family regulator